MYVRIIFKDNKVFVDCPAEMDQQVKMVLQVNVEFLELMEKMGNRAHKDYKDCQDHQVKKDIIP